MNGTSTTPQYPKISRQIVETSVSVIVNHISKGSKAMNNADIEAILNDAIGSDPQWEDGFTLNVIDYGKHGDFWTVEVSGAVNVEKITGPKFRSRAELVATDFCHCVETYVVLFDSGEVDTLDCTSVIYSALETVDV